MDNMNAGKILVVEDEAIIAMDVERMLRKQGYDVRTTGFGDTAIQIAGEYCPKLVLMDIKLRGNIDGITAAEQIFTRYQIPIVYLTAHADDETLRRATLARPFGYVLKPIDANQLRTAIEIAQYMHAADQKLRENELKFRTVLVTSLDGFCINDLDGSFLDVNDAFCHMLGYTKEELLAMKLQDIQADGYSQVLAEINQKISDTGGGRCESRLVRKDAHTIDVELSINFLPHLDQTFSFWRDITDRKSSEEKIHQLLEDLKRQTHETMTLYHSERETRTFVETLIDASRVVASTLDVDNVLDRILAQIKVIVKNDVSNIILVEDKQSRVVRSQGYRDFDPGPFIDTFVFPLSELPIRQQLIASGEAIVVPDVRQDTRWSATAETAWLRSYMAVPIRLEDTVIALINVGSAMPNHFTQVHATRLEAFAYQAAIAFQNARRFEHEQKLARQLEVLSRQLLNVQETERRHIARELHDEVGQALTAIQLRLQAMLTDHCSEQYRAEIEECSQVIDLALREVRNISLDLHPSILDDLGLVPAVRWFVFREAEWGNFTPQVVADLAEKRMPGNIELVCYRLVLEAITNIQRHAQAKNIVVEMWQRGNDLHLVIRDDGMGFNVQEKLEEAARGFSLGLLGMQERVMLVNGALDIQSTPGMGTEIHARIPVAEPDSTADTTDQEQETQ